MKKLINLVRTYLKSCPRCFGTGQIDLPNGSSMDCPVCKGKGLIK